MDEIPESLPTATIADRVGEYLYPEESKAMMVFENPDGKHFALKFDVKILVLLNKMCGVLISAWHKAKPDVGSFFRQAGEATVIVSDEMRGMIGIQFDSDIVHVLPIHTAIEFIDLIEKQIERIETPDDRKSRLAKKHPSIAIPRQRIIRP